MAELSSGKCAADVQIPTPPGVPEVDVRLRPERLAQFGFEPVSVLDTIQEAYQGYPVGQVYEGTRIVDVVVTLPPNARSDPGEIGSLLVDNGDGLQIKLQQLSDLFLTSGRATILHDGTSRVPTVTCKVRGRDLTSFASAARRAVS